MLDEAIAEQGPDLVEDPGHDGVELVRPVVEGEAVALEAGAEPAHNWPALDHRHRPARPGEVVPGGEPGHSPAENDDGALAHAFLDTTMVWPTQYASGALSSPSRRMGPRTIPASGPR